MQRIALIGPTYPYRGGIAHFTTLLTRHLRERDGDVLLVSFSRQYPAWLFPGESDKDPSAQPLRIEAEFLLDPLNPASWRRVRKRLAAWQPDVVILFWWHPYFAPAWAMLGRAVKRLPGEPKLVVICHNVVPHEQGALAARLYPHVIRSAIGRADGYVVHAETDAEALTRFLPSATPLVAFLPTYSELGTHADTASELPFQLPAGSPLLLFCGLIRPYKGLDILLESLALLAPQLSFHLLVAGEFWQEGEVLYRRQIARLQLQDRVTVWNAYLPDELLASCLLQANVVVLPYKQATQSAIIQLAFGHGTPVITTNVGGLAEAVADGRTGLVVPPEDPGQLAAAIGRYFADNLEDSFRRNIRADTRFAWADYVDLLLRYSEDC